MPVDIHKRTVTSFQKFKINILKSKRSILVQVLVVLAQGYSSIKPKQIFFYFHYEEGHWVPLHNINLKASPYYYATIVLFFMKAKLNTN